MIFPKKNEKGVVLIGVIVLLVASGMFAAAGASFIASSGVASNNAFESVRALALSRAGSEWFIERLRTTADWTTVADTGRAFAGGNFDIDVLTQTAGEIRFTSVGSLQTQVSGNPTVIRRTETWSVGKYPSAFKFAVFQGSDPGTPLNITASTYFIPLPAGQTSPTRVVGNIWSSSSVSINAPNQVTGGNIIVPSNKTVTGTGTYQSRQITAPLPALPNINTAPYTAQMAGFDALLAANSSSTVQNVNAGNFNVSGVMHFRVFNTSGNVTITGNGTIVARDGIFLHGQNGLAVSRLTITPSAGGSINFVTDRMLHIGTDSTNTAVTVNGPSSFYSRAPTATSVMVVRGGNVLVRNSNFYIRRRMVIQEGADFGGNNLFYLDQAPNSPSNNFLRITAHPNVTSIEGNIIGMSARAPGIHLLNAPAIGVPVKTQLVFRGYIYGHNPAGTVQCAIDGASVVGSVACDRVSVLRGTDLSFGDFSNNIPAGFDTSVARKENSWDGL